MYHCVRKILKASAVSKLPVHPVVIARIASSLHEDELNLKGCAYSLLPSLSPRPGPVPLQVGETTPIPEYAPEGGAIELRAAPGSAVGSEEPDAPPTLWERPQRVRGNDFEHAKHSGSVHLLQTRDRALRRTGPQPYREEPERLGRGDSWGTRGMQSCAKRRFRRRNSDLFIV